jgi:phthiodiolone/phenolphthiodiolone dimycocerosates ketoreductase
VGGIKPKKPQFFALGGGPKLIDVACKYADGFVAAVPCTVPDPDTWAKKVTDMKEKIERNGRDPEAFEFGLMGITLLHEDPDAIEKAIQNPLVRWLAAASGRMDMSDWAREGVKTVRPEGWHYALRHTPTQMSVEKIETTLRGVSDDMVRKGYMVGSPESVAKEFEPYIEAGATWITFFDVMPLALSLEESMGSIPRSIEVCRLAKDFVK